MEATDGLPKVLMSQVPKTPSNPHPLDMIPISGLASLNLCHSRDSKCFTYKVFSTLYQHHVKSHSYFETKPFCNTRPLVLIPEIGRANIWWQCFCAPGGLSQIHVQFRQLPHHGSYKTGHVIHLHSASSRNSVWRAWPTGT